MTAAATTAGHSIDSILDQLDRFHQRATYGAVAALVDSSPRSLMSGRDRDQRSSWIVSRKDGKPTGYEPDQTHPEINERGQILGDPEALRSWLEKPS
jgi:hypothetical protein